MITAVVTLSKKFFGTHPKAGEPTDFRDKVLEYRKIHTCRANYDYWKKKFDRMKEVGGVLSLRQWSGKPYGKGTTMELVRDIPSDVCGVQQLKVALTKFPRKVEEKYRVPGTDFYMVAMVDGKYVDLETLAHNDGLEVEDYMNWFLPAFKLGRKGERPLFSMRIFAVIQFTNFRY